MNQRFFGAVTLLLALGFSTVFSSFADDPKYPEFDKKVKKAKKMEGFFNLYQEDNQLYMEVPKAKLDKEFFLYVGLSKGQFGGMLLPNWTLGSSALYFKQLGKKLVLFEKELYYTAKKGTPMEAAVKQAYLDSLVHSFPIVAAKKGESSYLISLNSFFFQYPTNYLGPWAAMNGIQGADIRNTYWSRIQNFPKNMHLEIRTTLRLTGIAARYSSNQSFMYFSIVEKPKTSYKPRLADERIGYFTKEELDFSRQTIDSGKVRYITRWNLEKSDAGSESSVVKKPIVFHLHKSIPHKYRKYVRAGILEWNKAFEKLGFIGAVEARLPREGLDVEPSDVRYATVSWAADSAGFAIGPSRTNPYTGEIIDADVIVSSDWVNYMENDAEIWGPSLPDDEPEEGSEGEADKKDQKTIVGFWKLQQKYEELKAKFLKKGLVVCDAHFGSQVGRSISSMVRKMSYKLDQKKFKEWKEEFIGTYIKNLTMHEVGHTLGLRHNFKGSAVTEYERLKDPEWSKVNQPNTSVMDYDDHNIALDYADQGKYMNDSLGAYDYLAIEYGYSEIGKDEAKELDTIAQKLRSSGLDYCTDEDSWLGNDPWCQTRDLTDDHVAVAKDRIKLAQDLLKSVETSLITTGDSYSKLRGYVADLVSEYGNKVFKLNKYIAGIKSYRDKVNDKDGKAPFEPISREEQLKVLDFYRDYVFTEDAFEVPSDLLAKGRSNPWNWAPNMPLRLDSYFSFIRSMVIYSSLNPDNFTRLEEFHEKVDENALTRAELVEKFHDMLFTSLVDLKKGKIAKLSVANMVDQKEYVNHLIRLSKFDYAIRADTRAYLEHSLELVRSQSKSALDQMKGSTGFEKAATTRHLSYLHDKIQKFQDSVMIDF